MQALTKKNITLVLGGGGARAMTQVGVIKVLHKAGIKITRIVGVSAGAMMGALYASNPDPDYLERITLDTHQRKLLNITLFRLRKGFVTGEAFQNFITEQTGHKTFETLEVPFVAVAVDLKTGELIAIDQGELAPAVNASCALPPVFHPVNIAGRLLVDGGAVDPVPVNIAKRYPHDIVIAVNITQQLPDKMPTHAVSTFIRYHKIRLLAQSLAASEGADIVIHPYVADTHLFDSSQKELLIAEGERAAREQLEKILKLCEGACARH